MAWEAVNGPLLIHERLDYWFIQLMWLIANTNSKRRISMRKFLPPWIDLPLGDVDEGFARLLAMAEANEAADDADDFHVDR
jgi:hypothetical protein